MKRLWIASVFVVAFAALPLTSHAAPCNDSSARQKRESVKESPNKEEEPATLDDDCIEREIHFMPGALGVFFQPNASLGAFTGGGVQIAPFQWSHNNDRFGPSQGSFYVQAALLQSVRSKGALALYEAGATASFERNASRRWLIPYFGATMGGMTQADLGTSVYAYPMGGLHLYWHRNLMLDAEGGYHFPFEDVDRTRGPRAQVTARFSLW
jgi:hypothetical protein